MVLRTCLLILCVALVGCDKDPPAPPTTPPPSGGGEQITGNERIGWSQRAATLGDLAALRFNIYVDNLATEMQEVNCGDLPSVAGFSCSGRLPPMSPGRHLLAITAFVEQGGSRLESVRSATLTVNVRQGSLSAPAMTPVSPPLPVTTADGVRLVAFGVAAGLDDPTDLAVAPDGASFVAERAGRIRVVRNGRLLAEPAVVLDDVDAAEGRGLLAIALDPQFARTGHVFAVYTAAGGFRLSRFRAVGDTLGERAVLLDGIDAALARPAATLRFGPDAKLYLGLDDAGDPSNPGDLGSFNGKVLRLNPDGTTPPDQAGGTPVFALHVNEPLGMDWKGGMLWIAEALRLQGVVSASADAVRAAPVANYDLPATIKPGGLTLYRGALIPAFAGDLLLASEQGRAILRLRFAPDDPARIASTEYLLRDAVGPIHAIAVDVGGAVYFCTERELFALIPEPAIPAQDRRVQ